MYSLDFGHVTHARTRARARTARLFAIYNENLTAARLCKSSKARAMFGVFAGWFNFPENRARVRVFGAGADLRCVRACVRVRPRALREHTKNNSVGHLGILSIPHH